MKYAIRRLANRVGFDLVRSGRYSFDLVPMRAEARATPGKSFLADINRFLMRRDPVIFDVGANLGFTTRRFREAFPSSRIHAFEPSKDTFQQLEQGISDLGNITIWNCGLGSAPEQKAFEENTIASMSSFLPLSDFGTGQVHKVAQVEVKTVDDICTEAGIDYLDVLKSDTQGYELEVLHGATRMLSESRIGMIYLEVIFSDMYRGMPRFTQLCDFMLDHDFVIAAVYPTMYQRNIAGWTDFLLVHKSLQKQVIQPNGNRQEAIGDDEFVAAVTSLDMPNVKVNSDRIAGPERRDIAFVIPFRNEEGFLADTLDSVLAQDLLSYSVEVYLLDGGSTDRSREIADKYAQSTHSNMQLIVADNVGRTAPHGFNYGIRNSKARVIGLGGAHTIYPPHYFARALDLLDSVDAGVVGGGHNAHIPSSRSLLNDAMALLYQSPFGSGIAAYHTRSSPGYVDTVYGGFYRRDVFERVGDFDETLRKNQDNELNARVTAAGIRIYFDPALNTDYVQKTDLKSFVKRAYDFGRYHPITWRANPRAFRLRHAAPFLLVAYMLFALPLSVALGLGWFAVVPLLAYICMLAFAGLQLVFTKRGVLASIVAPFLFAIYHVLYGFGTLIGLLKLPSQRELS